MHYEKDSLFSELFSFAAFLERFPKAKKREEMEPFLAREGRLEALRDIGLDGAREDLLRGKVFLYLFPVMRISHSGGFSHYVPSGLTDKLWIFLADEEEEILVSRTADDLEKKLQGNSALFPPDQEGYILENQDAAIKRAKELLKMDIRSQVEVEGVVFHKSFVEKRIPLIAMDDAGGDRRFALQKRGKEARCAWRGDDGRVLTSEQLAGLQKRGGGIVAEDFSLLSYLDDLSE
jgi:hypothetical protein